jgi:hypothetical protein
LVDLNIALSAADMPSDAGSEVIGGGEEDAALVAFIALAAFAASVRQNIRMAGSKRADDNAAPDNDTVKQTATCSASTKLGAGERKETRK